MVSVNVYHEQFEVLADDMFSFVVRSLVIEVAWIVLEPMRVSLGYSGNIRGKVPESAGYFILTIPQTIIVIYNLFFQPYIAPLDIGLSTVMLILLLPQALLSYPALKRVTSGRAAAHYLSYRES